MNTEFARRQMIEHQVRTWDVSSKTVLGVLADTAREAFVPADYVDLAFADTEIPLAHGEVMLRPTVEGRLLQTLALDPDDEVLEVGTGTGYMTACLAKMSASVTSVDIHEDFIASAVKHLQAAQISNVELQCMDIMADVPEATFDAIAVTGSVPIFAEALESRFVGLLKPGGRLFLIVGSSPVMSAQLITRGNGDEWGAISVFETDITPLRNVPTPSTFYF